MNKLVWQLFEMLREVLPVTEANTKRLAEWAQAYRLVAGDPHEPAPAPAEETDDPPFDPEELDPDQEHELAELENHSGPIRSGRGSPPKKKRR
jgi:hypothetical protein